MADLKVADRILDVSAGNLKRALASRKETLAAGWLDRAVRAYPAETAALLRREGNPFGNPVGHALSVGIHAVIDGLISDADAGELAARLDPILKIRSVQTLPASQALSFVYMLKDAIVEELGDDLRAPALAGDWFELDARIDQVALLAFDAFTRWRETVHEIRVRDIKRRVSEHLRALELAGADAAADAANARDHSPER